MTVQFDQVVFAYDFSRIESVGGVRYLWDYGPNGFHFAFPGGAADPTPQLDGSLSFDGGDYLSLPAGRLAQFYAQQPTREHTLLMMAIKDDAVSKTAFSTWNAGGGGVNKGILLQATGALQFTSNEGQGAAALPAATMAVGSVRPSERTVYLLTVETAPRGIVRMASTVCTWSVGAFGTIVYDAAVIPRIGAYSGGQNWLGRLYYLALLRGALSSADLAFYSRLIAEGTSPKPWCVR